MRRSGLGNMPLTLFVIVAGVVMYLYLRRSHAGIDLAPSEQTTVTLPAPQPSVSLPPVLPQIPGTPGPVMAPVPIQQQIPIPTVPPPTLGAPPPSLFGGSVIQ